MRFVWGQKGIIRNITAIIECIFRKTGGILLKSSLHSSYFFCAFLRVTIFRTDQSNDLK